MVSLQAESSFWLHYEPEYPSSDDYISVDKPSVSSYPFSMIQNSTGDLTVENIMLTYAPNSFTHAYISYPKRFSDTDHYTLFVPLQSKHMDTALDMINTPGFSFKTKERRAYGQTQMEELLLQSMCPFRIHPFQLIGRQTSIDTLFQPNTFYIDIYGNINKTSRHIVSYIEFPHATIFFINSL